MEDAMKKQLDRYQAEFESKYNKPTWTREDIENMKDLKKLEYYTEVLCAMREGKSYPGSEYIDQRGMSYANQHRNMNTGRYMSGHYPMYYDDERMSAMDELRRMHQTQQNPEVRMAIEQAMRSLEVR